MNGFIKIILIIIIQTIGISVFSQNNCIDILNRSFNHNNFFDNKAKRLGFYEDMSKWEIKDWRDKTLAKEIQIFFIGAQSKVESVKLDYTEFMHPIVSSFGGGVSQNKQLARQNEFIEYLRENPEFRDITIEFQNKNFFSPGGPAQGVLLRDGAIIIYNGNGRLFAYKRAVAIAKKQGIIPANASFNLDVKIIDVSTLKEGAEQKIREAQEARGGLNYDPMNPDNVISKPVDPNLTLKKAVAKYYYTLSELNEQRQAENKDLNMAFDQLQSLPISGTTTQRSSEDWYELPNNRQEFYINSLGELERKTEKGIKTGDLAKLSSKDLEIGKKYLFIITKSGSIIIASENNQNRNRPLKHGDLSPARLHETVVSEVEEVAFRLTSQGINADEARTRALMQVVYNIPRPSNDPIYSDTKLQYDLWESRDYFKEIAPNLSTEMIEIKAQLQVLARNELLKESENFSDLFISADYGPYRGVARAGGDIVPLPGLDGKNLSLKINMDSSYSFARTDGRDLQKMLPQIVPAFEQILKENIEIEN